MISTLWVTPLVSLIQKRGLDGMYTAEIGSLGFYIKKKHVSHSVFDHPYGTPSVCHHYILKNIISGKHNQLRPNYHSIVHSKRQISPTVVLILHLLYNIMHNKQDGSIVCSETHLQ